MNNTLATIPEKYDITYHKVNNEYTIMRRLYNGPGFDNENTFLYADFLLRGEEQVSMKYTNSDINDEEIYKDYLSSISELRERNKLIPLYERGKKWVQEARLREIHPTMNPNYNEPLNILEISKIEPEIFTFLQSMLIEIQKIAVSLWNEDATPTEIANFYFTPFEDVQKYLRTQIIEGVSIDNQTLANNIGNLFYSNLADLLSAIGIEVQKDGDFKISLEGEKMNYGENIKQAGILISQASLTIQEAWKICEDKPFPIEKHTPQVKGVEIPNIDLATNISKLDYPELGNFLLLLAEKIKNDGENDEQNGKIKLSTELLNASKKLEQAGKLLKTGVYS